VEAGDRQSPSWRPFHGTDGTPNESAADVLVRVRQVRWLHRKPVFVDLECKLACLVLLTCFVTTCDQAQL